MLLDKARLAKWQEENLYRKRCMVKRVYGNEFILKGSRVFSFCSNDYLGLTGHPAMIRACKRALDHYGIGSGSSQLICGYTSSHVALEEELGDFLGKEKVLLFSTGYMANLGIIATLAEKQNEILIDKLCHASIIDGVLFSKVQFKRYLHNNMNNLEKILSSVSKQPRMIISEGVFSMSGEISDLSALIRLSKSFHADLILDDAHGIGVLGEHGRGCIEHFQIDSHDVSVLIGTFGKAFGNFGAFVASDRATIDYLTQFCRTCIYTTSLPPVIVEANRMALKIIQKEDWRRLKLRKLIDYFCRVAKELKLPLLESRTPIQPILVGDSKIALELGDYLKKFGILAVAIRPPTVPVNTARLRISLNVMHTYSQIDRLLEKIAEFIKLKHIVL